jgi:hypothetical protein
VCQIPSVRENVVFEGEEMIGTNGNIQGALNLVG